jgi:hypothetical protein
MDPTTISTFVCPSSFDFLTVDDNLPFLELSFQPDPFSLIISEQWEIIIDFRWLAYDIDVSSCISISICEVPLTAL